MATRRAQPVESAETDEQFEKSARKRVPAKNAEPKERKAKAEKAPKPEPEVDADGNPVKRTRRVMGERNWLANEIDAVLRAATGPVSVREITLAITNKEGEHPSSGAVAAALKRWSEEGYIQVTAKPLSFKAYPAKHKAGDLASFLEKSRETRLASRRAARAAATNAA